MQHITPEWLGSMGIEYTPASGPYFLREKLNNTDPDGSLYRIQLFCADTEEEMWSFLKSAAALYVYEHDDVPLYDYSNYTDWMGQKEYEEFKSKPGYYIGCWCVQLELEKEKRR